jgi:transposase
MKQKSGPDKAPAEQVLKDIRRKTRRQYSAEEKIRIVLEGLRGEENISELCRREGIAASMYYGWSKEFLEAGKRRLRSGEPSSHHTGPRLPNARSTTLCEAASGSLGAISCMVSGTHMGG